MYALISKHLYNILQNMEANIDMIYLKRLVGAWFVLVILRMCGAIATWVSINTHHPRAL